MDIPNQNDTKDGITIIRSEEHQGHVWMGIGGADHKPRHVHLQPGEARAVAHALLSYAEQVSVTTIDAGQFGNEAEGRA